MIPAVMDRDVKSRAERRMFELLSKDPNTEGWTVLHSLGLSRRRSGPYGEIDFVVAIPDVGLLCVEVKGGGVSCQDGDWYTANRRGEEARLNKSPFMQAREAMFALSDLISDHFGRGSEQARCPIAYAVAFPDVRCPPPSPEFEREEVIDFDDLRGAVSTAIQRVCQGKLRELGAGRNKGSATTANIRSIVQYLRPSFDLVPSRSIVMGRIEETLVGLTEEQYARLDELADNPRCLFLGAAGTGKTLLALEYARRASLDGAKVGLFCFNRLLGIWLKKQTEGTGIAVGNWHYILEGFIKQGPSAEEFAALSQGGHDLDDPAKYFDEEFPIHALIALEDIDAPFDVVVIDEAQDLLGGANLDVLDRLVRGGVAGGRWAIFGDFTGQTLYGNSADPVEELHRYCDHFVRARLTFNCRNTAAIAEATSIVRDIDLPRVRQGQEEGPPVRRRYWKTGSGLLRALEDVLADLPKRGFDIDDVVILSPRRLENSALVGVQTVVGFPLVDCSRDMDVPAGTLRFSTIHSFKGMESRAVVIVDIDEVEADWARSVLYVGMSRARNLLVLMIKESSRPAFESHWRRIRESGQTEPGGVSWTEEDGST